MPTLLPGFKQKFAPLTGDPAVIVLMVVNQLDNHEPYLVIVCYRCGHYSKGWGVDAYVLHHGQVVIVYDVNAIQTIFNLV